MVRDWETSSGRPLGRWLLLGSAGMAVLLVALGATVGRRGGEPLRVTPGDESPGAAAVGEMAPSIGAATPEGARLVGRLVLESDLGELPAACRRAAGRLGFAVPCPRELPTGHHSDSCAGRPCTAPGAYLLRSRFPAPGWCPGPDCGGQLVMTAQRVDPGRSAPAVTSCPGRATRLHSLPRRPGLLVKRCAGAQRWTPGSPGSPHGGHLLLAWRRGSVVYAVGVDERRASGEVVASVVARGARLVTP